MDRTELDKRLPLLTPESSPDTATEPQSSPVQRIALSQDPQRDASNGADIPSGCESAKRVLKERVKSGKREYFVVFGRISLLGRLHYRSLVAALEATSA